MEYGMLVSRRGTAILIFLGHTMQKLPRVWLISSLSASALFEGGSAEQAFRHGQIHGSCYQRPSFRLHTKSGSPILSRHESIDDCWRLMLLLLCYQV